MATFVTVNNTNLQDVDMGNEIILSYSEHRQVLSQSAVSAASGGDDAQSKTLWLAMQDWMEANCTSFVNHTDSPNPFVDVAAWLSVAGLNASGFSRYQDNVLLGYGNMQNGDDRMPVNFQELQKGFDALRWTKKSGSWNRKGENNKKYGQEILEDTWAEAISGAETAYDASSLTDTDPPLAWTRGGIGASGLYNAFMERQYQYFQVSSIPDVIQHSAALWLIGEPRYLVFDANGDNISETWEEQYTTGESGSTTYEQKVGTISEARPNWIPEPTVWEVEDFLGYRTVDASLILKWNGANGFSFTL